MRRTTLAAVAGIAAIFAASLLLLDRLAPGELEPGRGAAGTPGEPDGRPAPPPPGDDPAAFLPPQDPAPAPALDPAALTPEASARLAEGASRVDLAGHLDGLRARVTSRCGTMTLRLADDASDPTRGLTGEAVLLLDLAVASGQARVVGVKVLSQGTMRPALAACAQFALRNQVLSLGAGGGAGPSLTAPIVLSMTPGAPGSDAP